MNLKLPLILLFLSPANMIGYVVQSLLLLFIATRQVFIRGLTFDIFQLKTAFAWAFVCILSVLTGTTIGWDIDSKSYLLFAFVFMATLLSPFDIKVTQLSTLLLFIAVLILLSQVIMALPLGAINETLVGIYSSETQLSRQFEVSAGFDQFSWVRFGGIFINPNQCAKAYTFILGIYLATQMQGRKSAWHIFLTCFVGLFLTGSRTGMAIAVAMLVLRYGFRFSRLIIFSPVLILMFSVAFITNLRFVNIETLILSFIEKNIVIIEYIYHITDISKYALIFGTGDVSRIEYDFGLRLNSFDSELGYLLQGFGLMSIFIIPFFFWYSFKILRGFGYVFLLNLLWLFSSSILVNIRFCFLYLVSLSIIRATQAGIKIGQKLET